MFYNAIRHLRKYPLVLTLICLLWSARSSAAFFITKSAGNKQACTASGCHPEKPAAFANQFIQQTKLSRHLLNVMGHTEDRGKDNRRGVASLLILLGFCAVVGIVTIITPDIPDGITTVLVILGLCSFISSIVLGARGRRHDKNRYIGSVGMTLAIMMLAFGLLMELFIFGVTGSLLI